MNKLFWNTFFVAMVLIGLAIPLFFLGKHNHIKTTDKKQVPFSLSNGQDTVTVSIQKDKYFHMDSVIKVLLIQYYKAGWMDGSDTLVQLANDFRLTDRNIQKSRNVHWRRMEKEIMSKSVK